MRIGTLDFSNLRLELLSIFWFYLNSNAKRYVVGKKILCKCMLLLSLSLIYYENIVYTQTKSIHDYFIDKMAVLIMNFHIFLQTIYFSMNRLIVIIQSVCIFTKEQNFSVQHQIRKSFIIGFRIQISINKMQGYIQLN